MIFDQWLVFIGSAAVIVVAGITTSWLGDAVAKRTGLSGVWVGVILVASLTSLPEASTAVSSARLGVPDISAGDLFGSGLFNLAILAGADLLHYNRKLLKSVALGHVVSGSLAIIMTALAAILVVSKTVPSIGWISLGSVALIVIYLDGMWLISRHEKEAAREITRQTRAMEKELTDPLSKNPWWVLAFGLVAAAALIFLAAPRMVASAENIAVASGIETSFFGTLFIAITTSLPELVVAIAAVRIGAFDIVVGNIFGSNAFNMAVIFILDVFYVKGPVFAALSPVHAITGLMVIIITSVAIMGLVFRSEKRYFLLEPDAVLIMLLCSLSFYVVWRLSASS